LEGLSKEDILHKEKEEVISYDILRHAIKGWINIKDIKVAVIDNKLQFKDFLGTLKVRLGVNRYEYKIPTGLYAVGSVDENSPVLVTSNYKLSFDTLRKELDESGHWILVLDTNGINVWCAAGKGTFSTRELIYQIHKCELDKVVNTKRVILPQLGASGIEAYLLRKYTKFSAIYGPVRSEDILDFIKNKFTATEQMRSVTFTIKERLVLTPLEFFLNMKYIAIFILFFILSNFLKGSESLVLSTTLNTTTILFGNFIGSVIFPLLLGVLPFRSFVLNGGILGVIYSGLIVYNSDFFMLSKNPLSSTGIFILLSVFISYISFNFTGSTTFTSFTGVKKEAKIFIPLATILAFLGFILYIAGNIF
jgi:hypothetical protein